MPAQIFIAFAASDQAAADTVARTIETGSGGAIRCWLQPRDLFPGMAYGDSVNAAINDAQLFIVLVSSRTPESRTFFGEYLRIIDRRSIAGVPLLALQVGEIDPASKAIHLFGPGGLGAMPATLDESLPGLLARVERELAARGVDVGATNVMQSLSREPDEVDLDESLEEPLPPFDEEQPPLPPADEATPPDLIEGGREPAARRRIPRDEIELSAPPSSMPPPSEPPGAAAAPRPRETRRFAARAQPETDAVEFGIAHPASVARDAPFILGVWLFRRADWAQAEDRALAALGKDARFQSQGAAAIARGTALTIALQIDGWRIEPAVQTVPWTGEITNVAFRAQPEPAGDAASCIGDCHIMAGGIRIAQLFFTVPVSASPSASPAMTAGAAFKSAFASYASGDRRRVLARVQGIEKLGVKVFMDVHDLKPGAAYNEELFRSIDRSDVLYLFWSRQARASAYVEREWRYGLEKRGIAFIDPVPLVDPRKVPPPAELASEKHFADWTLAFIEYEKSASLLGRIRSWLGGDS